MSDKKIYIVVDGNGTAIQRYGSTSVWTTSHKSTAKGMATRLNNDNEFRLPGSYKRNHTVREIASTTASTPQEMVREFHEAFDLPVNTTATRELLDLRASLIWEEWVELEEEFARAKWCLDFGSKVPNRDRLTKEMADLLYVVYGAAVALGIDLEEAFRRVHESNMTKLVDGKPLMRDDGKVLKGPDYREPDLTGTY